jgi:hypothetical protein
MGSAEECALVGTLYIGCVCESTGRRSQKREEERKRRALFEERA